jgi:hypothetical protein
MKHNLVENNIIILSKQTLDLFLKQDDPADLIALYCFYYYTAKWQATNQPKATISYVAKGLKWGEAKVRNQKRKLIEPPRPRSLSAPASGYTSPRADRKPKAPLVPSSASGARGPRSPSGGKGALELLSAFDNTAFMINWETHTATCPHGKQSRKWQPDQDITGQEVIQIRFAKKDCQACPVRPACTRAKAEPRILTVRIQVYHEALQAA